MKGSKQADPSSVCLGEIMRGKRTWEYARHAEVTNQPNLSLSLSPTMFCSFFQWTDLYYTCRGQCEFVCEYVCVAAQNCFPVEEYGWGDGNEGIMEYWLLHPHFKALGYLINGLYVCDSQITMTCLMQLLYACFVLTANNTFLLI